LPLRLEERLELSFLEIVTFPPDLAANQLRFPHEGPFTLPAWTVCRQRGKGRPGTLDRRLLLLVSRQHQLQPSMLVPVDSSRAPLASEGDHHRQLLFSSPRSCRLWDCPRYCSPRRSPRRRIRLSSAARFPPPFVGAAPVRA